MSDDPNPSQDPDPDPSCSDDSQDMMNMFDCVWVKVEEEEKNEAGEEPDDGDENLIKAPPKKKIKRGTLLRCDQCDFTTIHNAYMQVHIFNHSNTELCCQYCEFKTKYPMSLKRHISINHSDPQKCVEKPKGRFECELCGYTSVYKWNLNSHKRKHKLEKPFKCKHCEYETAYRHNYLKHCKTHEEKTVTTSYKCDKCPFETKFKGHIQRHLSKIHNELLIEARYTCDRCEFATNEKWRLKLHEQRSKCEKVIKCAFCDFKSYYKCDSRKHRQIHFNDIERNGKISGYSIENATEKAVENHSVDDINKPDNVGEGESYLRCKDCDFETIYEAVMARHLSQVHNEVSDRITHEYNCEKCPYSTKDKFRLTSHEIESKSEQVLQCNLCSFETFYKCEEKNHKLTHSESHGDDFSHLDRIDTIDNCTDTENAINKSANSAEIANNTVGTDNCSSNLNKDGLDPNAPANKRFSDYLLDPDCVEWSTIQVLETADKERPFQCNFCYYSSKFKASVQRHFQRQHAGDKNRPYKCCNCDFSTKTKEQISLHNKRSQSNIQLTCQNCDYTTYFKCALVYHQKVHYVYNCKDCSYSCRKKYELTKHYSTHHLGNGIKCQYCDYTSARRENIVSHETTHTGIKPYNCSVCEYSTVRKTLLEKHFRRVHSDRIIKHTVIRKEVESLRVPGEDKMNVGGDKTLEQSIES